MDSKTPDPESLANQVRARIDNFIAQSATRTRGNSPEIVRLHEPTFGADEIWEALESMLTTRVTMGPKVKRFESEFSERFDYGASVMVNSGSSANLLAVAAITNPATENRLEPGDEVLVPAVCWSTTIWPLIQHGLIPVIVDIDPRTMNIDPEEAERAIGPKTRGIMLVHVYGNPCDMDAITGIAKRHNLTIVEDCCEALGAEYQGRPVGTFGDVGTFSFYFSHHITTLEGGMCVTDNPQLAELIRVLRAHGWVRDNDAPEEYLDAHDDIDPRFLFVNTGYNLRATELQGGFGYVQLPKLDGFIDVRTKNARYWREEFSHYRGKMFEFQSETPGGKHSWFGFPMTVSKSAPFSASELRQFLESRNIETRPIIAGNIAEQPALQSYEHRVHGDLPESSHVMRAGFTFGNHQAIDDEARNYISQTVHEFVRARTTG